MTSEEREKWRWTFAGQLFTASARIISEEQWLILAGQSVKYADALIAELEKSAVKECEHHSWLELDGSARECLTCGETFV